jgi:hypothetical protein
MVVTSCLMGLYSSCVSYPRRFCLYGTNACVHFTKTKERQDKTKARQDKSKTRQKQDKTKANTRTRTRKNTVKRNLRFPINVYVGLVVSVNSS